MKFILFSLFTLLFLGFAHTDEYCPLHGIERSKIQEDATDSIAQADRMGGRLFQTSFAVTQEDIAARLIRECRTYPDYCHAFNELIDRCHLKGVPYLYNGKHHVGDLFYNMHTECIAHHQNPLAYYERGRILFEREIYDEAFWDIEKVFEYGKEHDLIYQVEGVTYQIKEENLFFYKGKALLETNKYEEAIEALSETIKKNPKDKKALFNRAIAYFETGNFDQALKDYISSETSLGAKRKLKLKASKEFSAALLKYMAIGLKDAVTDFIPSVISSRRGISDAMWSQFKYPINGAIYFCNTCYEATTTTATCFKELDWDTLDSYSGHIKKLCTDFENLNDSEKGQLIGYAIGKFGPEILAPGAVLKGIKTVKKLREANRICNLEAMLVSKANKEAIVSSAVAHANHRETYLKNVKIQWDKQNKHIVGKHNYVEGKGIITVEEKELEILVKKHVGTGQRVDGEIGGILYKERIDFGRNIGSYALKKEGGTVQYFPTTKGIIIHSKNGQVHVFPTNPSAIIK